jgi:hypothetical protein
MTTLREAAQQALEALEWHYRQGHSNTLGGLRLKIDEKALRNLRAALAQEQAEPDTCTWHQDGDSDSGTYSTSCGHYFNLEDGTPEDNRMQWCCYCGKRLVQELITEGSDD